MTEATRVSTHGIDSATLVAVDSVSFGTVIPHERQAVKAKRWGWWYYGEYRLRSMKAYWHILVGWGLIVPILYLAAMGLGIGSLVDSNTGDVLGVPYLVFVGPALIVSSVFMECTQEFTYPIMGNFYWHRVYFGVASTPITPTMIAVGEVVVVGLRMFVQALAFWVILLVSGGTTSGWSWLVPFIAVLTAMSFGANLMAFSATRERDDFSFPVIQRFIVMPWFLFAGTFFPLESMPEYLQWIGWISPLWHGTQLARAASFSMPLSTAQLVIHLGFLVALVVLGILL